MSDDNATTTTASPPDVPQTPQMATSGPNLAHPDYWAKPGEWTPQFEGQRPPFAPGNFAAVKSGTRSPRLIEPRARELASGLIESRPDLASPSYAATVNVWATFVAQFEREAAKTKPDPYWLARFGNAAVKVGASLGLDPTSYARLQRDQAATVAIASHVDLDALMARGRAALAARDDLPTEVATAIPVDDSTTTRKDDR